MVLNICMDAILEGTGYAGKTAAGKCLPFYIPEVSYGFGHVTRKLLRTSEFFEAGNSELETIILAIDWNVKVVESAGKHHRIFDRGRYSIIAYQAVKEHVRDGTPLEIAMAKAAHTCDFIVKRWV